MIGTDYTQALEKRIAWIKWSFRDAEEMYREKGRYRELESLYLYQHTLANGETFFMNQHFADVVDYARRTVPDDLAFDPTWLVTKAGWMLIEKPFDIPPLLDKEYCNKLKNNFGFTPRIGAVSWFPGPVGSTQVFFFFDWSPKPGFGMWAYCTLTSGDKVVERVHQFENFVKGTATKEETACYEENRVTDELHEIRWFFTAMHLMSEKLTVTVNHRPERSTRRRMEKERTPLEPEVRIVTLRRLEEARQKDPNSVSKDYKWQWHVMGHWRNQWYPAENCHKTKWIEEYVKGDLTKPMKPFRSTVFKAVR